MKVLSNSSFASSQRVVLLLCFQLSGRNPVAYSWMKSEQDGRYCNEWNYLVAWMSWSETGGRSNILLYIVSPSTFIYFLSLDSILALFSGHLANPQVSFMLLLGWTLNACFWTRLLTPPCLAPYWRAWILVAQCLGLYMFLEYPKENPIKLLLFTWPNGCLKVPGFVASLF